MGQPVVHFEIIGTDPQGLRDYYGRLFGWAFDTPSPVAEEVSEPSSYGFHTAEQGIPGGIGGGQGYAPRTLFYVGVPDVAAAVADAERLGGTRVMGPATSPSGLVVAYIRDPEGNVVGLAQVG